MFLRYLPCSLLVFLVPCASNTVTGEKGKEDCSLLPSRRLCHGTRSPKYYYNANYSRCLSFDWGHCSNESKSYFNTFEECNNTCGGERISICKLPLRPGFGKSRIHRHFYDTDTGKCEVFLYKGTMGNQNNFNARELCESVCGKQNATEEDCKLDKKKGNITFGITFGRFYYSKTVKHCLWFIYGGVDGNRNNFETLHRCRETCKNVTVEDETKGKEDQGDYQYFDQYGISSSEEEKYSKMDPLHSHGFQGK